MLAIVAEIGARRTAIGRNLRRRWRPVAGNRPGMHSGIGLVRLASAIVAEIGACRAEAGRRRTGDGPIGMLAGGRRILSESGSGQTEQCHGGDE